MESNENFNSNLHDNIDASQIPVKIYLKGFYFGREDARYNQ